MEQRDSLINACDPPAGQLRPIRAFRHTPFGELRQFPGHLLQRHSNTLGEYDKSYPPEHCSRISPVARTRPLGFDETLFLVKAQRRCRHPAAACNLADRQQIAHAKKISNFSLDFKFT
jgi:hypothetical protein